MVNAAAVFVQPAKAVALLPEQVQNGVKPNVPEKLTIIEVTRVPPVADPLTSVEPEVIDPHPVPHVGAPVLPDKNPAAI